MISKNSKNSKMDFIVSCKIKKQLTSIIYYNVFSNIYYVKLN